MAKKKKIRYDRMAFVGIVTIVMLLGIYKGVTFAADQVMSFFDNDNVTEPVTADEETHLATIVLDPGHGGIDAGAKKGNLYEKNITMKTAKYAGEALEKQNIKVVYTRTTDTVLHEDKQTDLQMRAEMSAKNKAKYYISIHVNDFDKSNDVSGFEIYTKNDVSIALATSISSQIEKLKYSKNRGLQDGGDLAVLRQNTVPSVLVEIGYIKGNDYNYLNSDEKLKHIGEAIATGIMQQIPTEKASNEGKVL